MKLSRADVEWLLATHENGRGPVDWSDGSQRGREELDVHGADGRSRPRFCTSEGSGPHLGTSGGSKPQQCRFSTFRQEAGHWSSNGRYPLGRNEPCGRRLVASEETR